MDKGYVMSAIRWYAGLYFVFCNIMNRGRRIEAINYHLTANKDRIS